MHTPESVPPSFQTSSGTVGFREIISDAIAYWEPRRIVYTLILTAIVVGRVALAWPHFRSALSGSILLALFVLAVLANVCYCAAYLVDIPMQYSSFRNAWRRWRWALWMLGTALAGPMAYYWTVDELNL
jgi:hypothetical protein